jgi:hypothetical protein
MLFSVLTERYAGSCDDGGDAARETSWSTHLALNSA